jgi:Domain of unknown function (DUF5753)
MLGTVTQTTTQKSNYCCELLIRAKMVPGRAGSDARVDVQMRDWTSHEQSTRILRDWCPSIVTGLLQTEDYARCTSATTPMVGEDEVSARVAARIARQQRVLLRDDDPPAAWFLLDHFALLRQVGTPDVMAAQLRHLDAVARLPHVTIQVVPPAVHGRDAHQYRHRPRVV